MVAKSFESWRRRRTSFFRELNENPREEKKSDGKRRQRVLGSNTIGYTKSLKPRGFMNFCPIALLKK